MTPAATNACCGAFNRREVPQFSTREKRPLKVTPAVVLFAGSSEGSPFLGSFIFASLRGAVVLRSQGFYFFSVKPSLKDYSPILFVQEGSTLWTRSLMTVCPHRVTPLWSCI